MAQDPAPSRPGGPEGSAQPPSNAPRLGRYTSILLSVLGMMIFGFGTAFVSSLHQYLFFRFGVSQVLVGFYINSISLGEAGRSGCSGSSGRRRTGCTSLRACRTSRNPITLAVEERTPTSGRLEEQRICAQRAFHSHPPSSPPRTRTSPLRSPDTPARLMFVGP